MRSSPMAKTKASSNPSGRAVAKQPQQHSRESAANGQALPANGSSESAQAIASTNGATASDHHEINKSALPPELTEKVKELLRLAQEQGYLTYGDVNESLPDNLTAPEHIEQIVTQLRNLEVDIVDQAEVDRI